MRLLGHRSVTGVLHAIYHAIAWTWGGDGQGGPNSTGYLITSGPLAASAVAGGVGAWLWRSRCEERRCWRSARRKNARGENVCAKHFDLGLPKSALDVVPLVRESVERHEDE